MSMQHIGKWFQRFCESQKRICDEKHEGKLISISTFEVFNKLSKKIEMFGYSLSQICLKQFTKINSYF